MSYKGYKHTPEARAKIAASKRGCKLSAEHRQNISDTLKGRRCGPKNPNWKGGQWKSSRGYIWIRALDHPHAASHGYVMEHRLVMEKHLGRYLRPDEVVHHVNGRRADNRIENLRLVTTKNHNGELICPSCECVIYVR